MCRMRSASRSAAATPSTWYGRRFDALQKVQSPADVASRRGLKVSEILNRTDRRRRAGKAANGTDGSGQHAGNRSGEQTGTPAAEEADAAPITADETGKNLTEGATSA